MDAFLFAPKLGILQCRFLRMQNYRLHSDENFGSYGSDIDMWKFYNLLTGANKSSYIDSFLDRSFNATEVAQGINAALHGDDRYSWFID